jgi:hypothetical protein
MNQFNDSLAYHEALKELEFINVASNDASPNDKLLTYNGKNVFYRIAQIVYEFEQNQTNFILTLAFLYVIAVFIIFVGIPCKVYIKRKISLNKIKKFCKINGLDPKNENMRLYAAVLQKLKDYNCDISLDYETFEQWLMIHNKFEGLFSKMRENKTKIYEY